MEGLIICFPNFPLIAAMVAHLERQGESIPSSPESLMEEEARELGVTERFNVGTLERAGWRWCP